MGIADLFPFLDKKCPSARGTLPLSSLAGQRVAIDIFGWLYANKVVIQGSVIDETDVAFDTVDYGIIRSRMRKQAAEFFLSWLCYKITPVAIFEGSSPEAKEATRAERKAKYKESTDKLTELKSKISELDPLEVTPGMISDLRKLMRNMIKISQEDIYDIKEVLMAFGLPFMMASGEAEQLCSMLCIEGRVAAVYSADADNLAYGCPLLIRKLTSSYNDEGEKIHQCLIVSHSNILEELQIDHDFFRDLCIMAGCDYNKNIRNIGITRAFSLLKEHGSIENIVSLSKYAESSSCLNYELCRKMFSLVPSFSLILDGRININRGRIMDNFQNIMDLGLGNYTSRYLMAIQAMPEPKFKPVIHEDTLESR